ADLRALADMGLPVIASGGVTTMDDITALQKISAAQPNLIGAIVGRAIYEGTISVKEACGALAG
ncbi:MAG: HisA/HisF-related TIM barrel protein, partial [Fuerstiella sp.]